MQLERRYANAGDASEVPVPQYILCGHTSQINALHFSKDNKWLLSGSA
jgi:WD40 repeat protein